MVCVVIELFASDTSLLCTETMLESPGLLSEDSMESLVDVVFSLLAFSVRSFLMTSTRAWLLFRSCSMRSKSAVERGTGADGDLGPA